MKHFIFGLMSLLFISDAFAGSANENILIANGKTVCTATHLQGGILFVTAAHCLEGDKMTAAYTGANYRQATSDQVYRIRETYSYPSFDRSRWSQGNDIGFVLLEKPILGLGNQRSSETIEVPPGSHLEMWGYGGGVRNSKTIRSGNMHDQVLMSLCTDCGKGDSGAGVFYRDRLLGVFSAMDGQKVYFSPLRQEHIDWLVQQLKP